MKAVLISIQPKWVEKIASGEKTIEVRKSRPKLETPFKVYIYETKDKQCEDICICGYKKDGTSYNFVNHIGKVIGEFVCDKIYGLAYFVSYEKKLHHNILPAVVGKTCLEPKEIDEYLGDKDGYCWHISDLKIYDKPKELGEFFTPIGKRPSYMIERPPQSWCYVEDVEQWKLQIL